jgi:hypothetical protein
MHPISLILVVSIYVDSNAVHIEKYDRVRQNNS